MFKRGEVVQFGEDHKWCGCLGIVKEVKEARIMVGVPMPPRTANEGRGGTAYIFAGEKDLLKLMLEMVGSSMTVVSQITTFDPEEEEEEE